MRTQRLGFILLIIITFTLGCLVNASMLYQRRIERATKKRCNKN